MKKTLLFVLLIHTFLFSQIMILKNQDKIIIDNDQTLALNHVNHDQKQILKEYNGIDPRVKKLLEEKPNKDSNLSKEDEELSNKVINTIQTIGNVYNAKDDKERDDLIRDLASNYLSLQANTLIQEYLQSLNHSINSEFSLNYKNTLDGKARVLIPFTDKDNPKISYFLQSGIGGYDNNRIIGHFGGGIRYYPNALALNNSGNIMLGLNLVYDHDFSREHKRMSLGFESMLDTLAFHANIYQRLSGWINSYDFKNTNNNLTFLERPANGWDMGVKYAFPSMSNVAVFANMSKWYGEKVAPFGNVSCYEDLEKNPLIYEGGITYSPCPALTFSLSHKISNESDKQGTNIAMNFNIPLDKDAFKHAFDPKFAGINNTIEGSRTNFIDRDYSMVLEYKAINNAYHISYCGNLGDNTHCIMLKNGFNQAVKNVAMSVTPEQKSVILKDGNHYITNDSGKVFVKIIHAYGIHQTNLITKAGNAQESFPITIIAPKGDFRVFAKPSNIQRHEQSLITFAGSDLASDLDINWKLIGKGSLEKTPSSDKTDKDGISNIIYKPDTNMKDKEKATIIANVLGVTLKAFVQIAIYGDNDIILDKTTIGNKEKAHASYKNLKANSTKVKWSIQGDNALFIDKDKTTKELNLIADANGESNVEIIGLSGNEKVKIIVKNMSDELVKEKSKVLEIKNYSATMELPTGKDPVTHQDFEKGMIDYKSDFEVKLKGLMPKTKVLWKAKDIQSNKTLRISNDKESTADDKGESKVVFEGVKDFNIKRLQIIATYNQSTASTQEVSGEIKLHQYTPSISFSKDKIHAYESENIKALKDPKPDHVEVTIKGGKPNEKIEWSLNGDASLSNQEATFNASGEAKATITSKAPFKANPIISVNTLDQKVGKELPYEIKEYTPEVEYPSFRGEEKLIEYDKTYKIKISNLLPNSIIDGISGSKGVKAKKDSFSVNYYGETVLEFDGISDYSVKDITIKFNYIQKGGQKAELTLEPISVFDEYDLVIAGYPFTIKAIPNDSTSVALIGGHPGSKVEWSLSGDATLSKQETVFNDNGEARATITSKDPFKTDPVISVNALGRNLSEKLSYETVYTPEIDYPSLEGHEKMVDILDDFNIIVRGLMPNSEISNISGFADLIKPAQEKFKVDNKGEVIIAMKGVDIEDYYSVPYVKLYFSYMKTKNTKENFNDTIKISKKEYTPEVSCDKSEVYDIPNQQVTCKIKGGKPKSLIRYDLAEKGDFAMQADDHFNDNGEATINIQTQAPYENKFSMQIKAATINPFLLHGNVSIRYKHYNLNPKVINPPSFKGQKNTIDYESDINGIQFCGFFPNSMVIFDQDPKHLRAKQLEHKTDSEGCFTVDFFGYESYSTNEYPKAEFGYTYDDRPGKEYAVSYFNLYKYNPEIHLSKEKSRKNKKEEIVATLKNGRPHSKVEWDINGDFDLVSKKSEFDNNGQATVTLMTKEPYQNDILISATTLGQKFIGKVHYLDDTTYKPNFGYPVTPRKDGSYIPNSVFYHEPHNIINVYHMRPNSKFKIEPSSITVTILNEKDDYIKTDSTGNAVINFQLTNPTVRKIWFTITYESQEDEFKTINTEPTSVNFAPMHFESRVITFPKDDPQFSSENEVWIEIETPNPRGKCVLSSYRVITGPIVVGSGGIGSEKTRFKGGWENYGKKKINLDFSCYEGATHYVIQTYEYRDSDFQKSK
ncbi:TPA: inverse autotransporter beta domain-containing protein [Campylobacter lari]|nr:inverse autotransporter beta domain-containing protein [Campylobacter lari]